VFITRNGTWHFPTNVQGRLWHIRHLADYADLAALQDVSPHSFRRPVATEIDEVHDAEAAKNQLGHTSKTVTERHYINRKLVPDYRAATERLAPARTTAPPEKSHERPPPAARRIRRGASSGRGRRPAGRPAGNRARRKS
jgi:integrase